MDPPSLNILGCPAFHRHALRMLRGRIEGRVVDHGHGKLGGLPSGDPEAQHLVGTFS